MNKKRVFSLFTSLIVSLAVVLIPMNSLAMEITELPVATEEQYTLCNDQENPIIDGYPITSPSILRFGAQNASINSISINFTDKIVTFDRLQTSRIDIDDADWSLVFSGTNEINKDIVNEDPDGVISLTVLRDSTLRIGGYAYNSYLLGENTVSDVEFETASRVHTIIYSYLDEDHTTTLTGAYELDCICTEGPITLSNSTSSSLDDTSASEGSADGDEVPAESPTPAVQNNVVELGDGVSLESVLPGSYSSILPVAVQTPGALVGRLIEAGDVLPAPANFRDYSATVSEFNSTDSPASAAVIDTYAEATGQDVIGIMNINLVDGSAASPAPGAGLDIRDANSATEGSILFPVFSNGEASWACADGAAAIVVGLGGTAAALRTVSICGVTEGGGVFIQPDLDKNPQTATFYAFRGNAAYGICQDSIAPAETGNSVQTNRVITNSISPVITPSSSLPLAAAPGKTMAVYAIEGSDVLGLPRYIDGDRVFWTVRHF